MNKTDLINAMSEKSGLTKVQSKDALEGFVSAVEDTLKTKGKVSLVGFGSFSVSKREAREGRNPQNGEVIKIAAKNVVKFKAGSELVKKVQ